MKHKSLNSFPALAALAFSMAGIFPAVAHADDPDEFHLIRDGKDYVCTPDANHADPGAAVHCATKAFAGPFTRDQAFKLCQGAGSDAPADCGTSAFRGPFSLDESVELCTRAHSTGPSECATRAFRGPFSKEQAVRLCRRTGRVENADCAIQAFRGPYSADEAVSLCKANPRLLMRLFSTAMQYY